MDEERAEKVMREAEEKFRSNDIEGAKRMVLRAQQLFPSLPGLPQMLAAFNVHIAAASKDAKGHTNWYAVLDVDSSDDIKTIKKQYLKLCLLIHPDKNRSSAAEGAFKLINQAWETISGNAGGSEKPSTGTSGSPQTRVLVTNIVQLQVLDQAQGPPQPNRILKLQGLPRLDRILKLDGLPLLDRILKLDGLPLLDRILKLHGLPRPDGIQIILVQRLKLHAPSAAGTANLWIPVI